MTIVGVFPAPELRTGGHKRYAELSRQLVARGHRVVHIVRAGTNFSLAGESIPVISPYAGRGITPEWLKFGRAVRRGRATIEHRLGDAPDAVLTFGETNFYAARVLGSAFGVPVVFALRSNFVDEYLQFGGVRYRVPLFRGLQRRILGWWKHRLERWFADGADLVVFQTEYDRDNVAERAPGVLDRAVVIPNSFRVSWLDGIPTRSGPPTRLRSLLYLGNLGERKGVQYLFPAIAELVHRGVRDFHLDVIGFGGLEEWAREYVTGAGLDDVVTFHGRIDRPLSQVAGADLLVIPSLYDSFPNTVLEALYVGTPVIGSDAAGIRTMLRHEELLFPRGDATALADRLQTLIDDPEAFRRVCTLAADRRETFDFDWAERWEQAIAQLLSRNPNTDHTNS